jgi:NADH-quinone oxidoreductase subunit G
MSDSINLTINSQKISVKSGMKVVDAAKMAGIDISVFCYHPKLEPVGACRLCLVKIGRPQRDRSTGEPLLEEDGSPKIYYSGTLETACTVPVEEGMVVQSDCDEVLKARKDILEFLLTSHPLDCPVCDKGGECSLQELTFDYGLAESRFPLAEKIELGKHIPLGDLIYLDQERCIQCGRCIRFQREIAADPVLDFYHRGRKTDIVSYSDPPFDSYWSGNTTDLCPVGALTTRDFRFEARIWEMDATPSICSHCPVGCNIMINTRQEPKSGKAAIQRVMPRQNEWVNELWICDKGRFGYHFTNNRDRLTKPLARNTKGKLKPVSWSKALKLAVEAFGSGSNGLMTLVGGRLTNEDYYNLKLLTENLSGQAVLNSPMAGGNLVPQVGLGPGSNLLDLGSETAILVLACDLEEEAPLWWLRVKAASERGAHLIVANPRETKLERFADQVLRYDYGGETQVVLDILEDKNPAAETFKGSKNGIIIFGSEGLGFTGSRALAQACTNLLIKTKRVGKKNSGLIPVWPGANHQGAWDMGFEPLEDIGFALYRAESLIIAGADPVGDGLIEDLSDKFVLVQELFLTETADQADLVIPVLAATEKSGTYTSGERRVQRYEAALSPPGDCLADYVFAAKLGEALGMELPLSSEEILVAITENFPAYSPINLGALRESPPQWPPVSKEALSFTGTVVKNGSGIGCQLELVGNSRDLLQKEIDSPEIRSGSGILTVPVTRLYDQGIMIRTSEVLGPRLNQNQLFLHPELAEKMGLSDQAKAVFQLRDNKYQVTCQLDPTAPLYAVLIPRSMGIPLGEPGFVEIKAE